MASNGVSISKGDRQSSDDEGRESTRPPDQNNDQQKPKPDCLPTAPTAVESRVPGGGAVTTCGSPAVSAPEEALTTVTTSSSVDDESVAAQTVSSDPVSPSHSTIDDGPPPQKVSSPPAQAPLGAENDGSSDTVSPPPADTERARVELPEPAAVLRSHVSDTTHHIKWVQFHGTRSPVITQNVNGPCPLLALINVMLLKGKVQLPSALEVITIGQLMDYIGDTMLDSAPAQSEQPDFLQNMQDAVAIVPKLQTGLDVNVKFCGVQEFEYTPECCIFDLLHVRLYHGWLVEPSEPEVQRAVGQCGYNQLVDKIITNKSSNDPELSHQALLAENFLESTASQLTAHGVSQLRDTMRDGELAVFFRNNHFSTIYRYQDLLYLLVTDQGFLREPRVVWETLSSTDGAGQFVNGDFEPLSPERPPASGPRQVDQDYLVALSLQEENCWQRAQDAQWEEYKQAELGSGAHLLSDAELARRLQEEEQRGARQEQEQQQLQPAAPSRQVHRVDSSGRGSEGRRKNCCIM